MSFLEKTMFFFLLIRYKLDKNIKRECMCHVNVVGHEAYLKAGHTAVLLLPRVTVIVTVPPISSILYSHHPTVKDSPRSRR